MARSQLVLTKRRGQALSGDYANGGSETQGMFYAAWCSWLVQVQALQFEWAWQHPMVSIAVREAASKMSQQAQRGVQGKMKLLFAMLNEQPWCFFPLTVQLLSSEWLPLQAKCLQPPAHVRVDAAAMEVSS
eukprot:jgi/Astpho2/8697/Aster-05265